MLYVYKLHGTSRSCDRCWELPSFNTSPQCPDGLEGSFVHSSNWKLIGTQWWDQHLLLCRCLRLLGFRDFGQELTLVTNMDRHADPVLRRKFRGLVWTGMALLQNHISVTKFTTSAWLLAYTKASACAWVHLMNCSHSKKKWNTLSILNDH